MTRLPLHFLLRSAQPLPPSSLLFSAARATRATRAIASSAPTAAPPPLSTPTSPHVPEPRIPELSLDADSPSQTPDQLLAYWETHRLSGQFNPNRYSLLVSQLARNPPRLRSKIASDSRFETLLDDLYHVLLNDLRGYTARRYSAHQVSQLLYSLTVLTTSSSASSSTSSSTSISSILRFHSLIDEDAHALAWDETYRCPNSLSWILHAMSLTHNYTPASLPPLSPPPASYTPTSLASAMNNASVLKWFFDTADVSVISRTAKALAIVGRRPANFFHNLNQQKNRSFVFHHARPRIFNLTDIVFSLGTLGYDLPHTLPLITRQSKWIGHNGRLDNLADYATGLALLDEDQPEFFKELAERTWHLKADLAQANFQVSRIRILHSLCVLDLYDRENFLIGVLWRAILKDHDKNYLTLSPDEWVLFERVQMFLRLEWPHLARVDREREITAPSPPPSNLSAPVFKKLDPPKADNTPLALVTNFLSSMGFETEQHVTQSFVANQGIKSYTGVGSEFLEIHCAHFTSKRIAFEINERADELVVPTHHARRYKNNREMMGDRRLNGVAKAKQRLLRNMGWCVVNVGHRQVVGSKWNNNRNNREEPVEVYMTDVLKEQAGIDLRRGFWASFFSRE